MAQYVPPRRSSQTAYNNPAYAGPGPGVPPQQVPVQQPPPPSQNPSYYQPPRPRGGSNASTHSYNGQPAYAAYATPPVAAAPQAQYFPPPPASTQLVQVPEGAPPPQLHPQEAYAVASNPYGHRRRTSSTASHMSTASHRSHHSHHSHHSDGTRRSSRNEGGSKQKPGERPTMGDTVLGIWDALKDIIPVGRR